MKFEDVLKDIQKLVGKKIQSIRHGANITITALNLKENQLRLMDSKGKERVRSLDELRRIWDHLCLHPATHVDAVLAGSGSSRNQPETIFANLPYIEVIYLSNKKHIVFTGKNSHLIGSVKEMDPIGAQKVRMTFEAAKQVLPAAIIVVKDPRPISTSLQGISGLQPTSTQPGLYNHSFSDREILVVSASNIDAEISTGTYIPLSSKGSLPSGKPVKIDNQQYFLLIRDGVNFLLKADGQP